MYTSNLLFLQGFEIVSKMENNNNNTLCTFRCTKTSSLPSSGVMKPKPLSSMNFFTTPFGILRRAEATQKDWVQNCASLNGWDQADLFEKRKQKTSHKHKKIGERKKHHPFQWKIIDADVIVTSLRKYACVYK